MDICNKTILVQIYWLVTTMGWMDVPKGDQGDFRSRCAVDTSSFIWHSVSFNYGRYLKVADNLITFCQCSRFADNHFCTHVGLRRLCIKREDPHLVSVIFNTTCDRILQAFQWLCIRRNPDTSEISDRLMTAKTMAITRTTTMTNHAFMIIDLRKRWSIVIPINLPPVDIYPII